MSVTHVVLLGPMAAGKTTLGRALGRAMNIDVLDSDQMLAERTGLTAGEIAASSGVPELHRLEREVLAEALTRDERSVVAAAASVVDDEATRNGLLPHLCLWIDADPSALFERLGSESHRPVLGEAEATSLSEVRRQLVTGLITAVVDTTTSSVDQSTALAMSIIVEHSRSLEDR